MKKKALLTLASLGLLTTVLIYATIAWYTNIANVTGFTFDVATFDFQVNYAPDNFVIQVDDYLNVDTDKAAPGTGGVIPIRVSTTGEAGATYAINLDFSKMAPEFKDRIRFTYYTRDGAGNYVEHVLDENAEDITGTIVSEGSVTEYIYWEWIYTADITPILVAPYLEGETIKWTNYACMDDMTYAQIESAVQNWNTYLNTSLRTEVQAKYEELKQLGHIRHEGYTGQMMGMDPKDPFNAGAADPHFKTLLGLSGRALKEKIEELYLDAHDAFDTELALGKYDETFVSPADNSYSYTAGTTTVDNGSGGTTTVDLLAYQKAMEVTLMVSGTQAMPLKDDGNTTWTSQGTSAYNPNR